MKSAALPDVQSQLNQTIHIVETVGGIQAKIDQMSASRVLAGTLDGNRKQELAIDGEVKRMMTELDKLMTVVKRFTGKLTIESADEFVANLRSQFEQLMDARSNLIRLKSQYAVAQELNEFPDEAVKKAMEDAMAKGEEHIARRLAFLAKQMPEVESSTSGLVIVGG